MTITEEQLDLLLTSIELHERESELKDELIHTLQEQILLLEARITQLTAKLDRMSVTEKKG